MILLSHIDMDGSTLTLAWVWVSENQQNPLIFIRQSQLRLQACQKCRPKQCVCGKVEFPRTVVWWVAFHAAQIACFDLQQLGDFCMYPLVKWKANVTGLIFRRILQQKTKIHQNKLTPKCYYLLRYSNWAMMKRCDSRNDDKCARNYPAIKPLSQMRCNDGGTKVTSSCSYLCQSSALQGGMIMVSHHKNCFMIATNDQQLICMSPNCVFTFRHSLPHILSRIVPFFTEKEHFLFLQDSQTSHHPTLENQGKGSNQKTSFISLGGPSNGSSPTALLVCS